MQERVYIVQTPVCDTSRCDQRLEAPPHWHMGKDIITKRHRQSSWSMEKAVAWKHEGKMTSLWTCPNWNRLSSEPTHYTTGSFQSTNSLPRTTTPDYGLGTVGKCLGPTTSKRPTKDGCKICWTDVSQSVTNGLCIVSTKLSILALNINFHQ